MSQEQAVTTLPMIVDEYGTMYRDERIVGNMVPISEGADTYVIVVRDMAALLGALDAVPREQYDKAVDAYRVEVERTKRQRDKSDRYCEAANADCEEMRAANERLLRFVRDVAAEAPSNVDHQFRTIRRLAQNIVADLSADAENSSASGRVFPGDAEPASWQTPEDASRISMENMAKRGFHHDFGCAHDPCECTGEPSRAESDECRCAPDKFGKGQR